MYIQRGGGGDGNNNYYRVINYIYKHNRSVKYTRMHATTMTIQDLQRRERARRGCSVRVCEGVCYELNAIYTPRVTAATSLWNLWAHSGSRNSPVSKGV